MDDCNCISDKPCKQEISKCIFIFFQSYTWLKLEYKTCFFSGIVIRYKAVNTTDILLPDVLYETNDIVVFVM